MSLWANTEEPTRNLSNITTKMMYICRSKIPSHIYAKNQYRQETELRNSGALYIPTYEYNYKVITGCDTILQEYYITDRRKCKNIKRYTIMNSTKALTSYKRKTRETSKGPGRIGVGLVYH